MHIKMVLVSQSIAVLIQYKCYEFSDSETLPDVKPITYAYIIVFSQKYWTALFEV